MKLNLPFISPLKYAVIASVIFLSAGCEKHESLNRSGNAQSLSNSNSHFSSANEHIISEEKAAEYIQRFKQQYPGLNTQSFFTKRELYKILAQPQVSNMRYYFGQSIQSKPEFFMLAADESYNDIIISGNIIAASPAELLSSRYGQINWQDDQLVGLAAASASTKRHRESYPETLLGGIFPKEAIHLLLIKNAVFGVFIEYGLDESNAWVAILRPLDKEGNINPVMIIEAPLKCPPNCGQTNYLNSDM